jgi:hypothetical protein
MEKSKLTRGFWKTKNKNELPILMGEIKLSTGFQSSRNTFKYMSKLIKFIDPWSHGMLLHTVIFILPTHLLSNS